MRRVRRCTPAQAVPAPALTAPALTAPPSEEETNEAKAVAVSDLLAAKREAADEIAVRNLYTLERHTSSIRSKCYSKAKNVNAKILVKFRYPLDDSHSPLARHHPYHHHRPTRSVAHYEEGGRT